MKKNEKKITMIVLMLGIMVLSAFFIFKSVYYNHMIEQESFDSKDNKQYTYQFEMIVDNPESAFWQAVYASAREIAEQRDVLLELTGNSWDNTYDKIDHMNMSIAAQVDGIILEYNGEKGLEEKINEAVEQGIPVVTVMGDAPASKRQSFVGINDYQMGVVYGEEVAKYVNEDTKSIMILKKMNPGNMKQSQLFAQISNGAKVQLPKDQELNVDGKTLLSSGAFDTEETIRNIFYQAGGPPDILVCMDEETTECAYQAMIDYNLAGQVKIIGYYTSKTVMEALEKGLIPSTCAIDTGSLGRYSVEALVEYINEGRVNVYHNVDLHFVTADMLSKDGEQESDEEIQMEKSVSGK